MNVPRGNPFINGNLYSSCSIELIANGLSIDGLKSINYSDKLEPGKVTGTGPLARGVTRGKYSADGNLEVYRDAYEDLMLSLGGIGAYERFFGINIVYFEPALGVVIDTVVPRLGGSDSGNDMGSSDGSVIKLPLIIITPILWNGTPKVLPI